MNDEPAVSIGEGKKPRAERIGASEGERPALQAPTLWVKRRGLCRRSEGLPACCSARARKHAPSAERSEGYWDSSP